jgi:hypothetical protein
MALNSNGDGDSGVAVASVAGRLSDCLFVCDVKTTVSTVDVLSLRIGAFLATEDRLRPTDGLIDSMLSGYSGANSYTF